MLSMPESAPGRIVKQPLSFSAARTVPSSLPLQHQQQVQAGPSPAGNSSSTQAPGPSSGLTPASGGVMGIMDTIPEDTSIDSHLGVEGTVEEDFLPQTGGACSSDTRSSYEDLTELSPQGRARRLQRQECIDSKETEC